jgi:predicted ATPase/DNA-binding CsgD family transcriptional regulator
MVGAVRPPTSENYLPSVEACPASRTTVPNHSLPVTLTTFHGRDEEVNEVRHLLGRHRLVTVIGPGGVGKTRLALEVAASVLGRFDDGVQLVELAQIDDPEGVSRAAAEAFKVRANSGVTIIESLAAVIGSRHALIVLDNCEHVIERAAALCSTLLQSGHDLRILATSREPLQITGEARYPLSPLDVPNANESLEQAGARESVELFVERARCVDPAFELSPVSIGGVSELVRRLDGMPLAIELAAAQIGELGLDQLVLSLDDRFKYLVNTTRGVAERQSSLGAAVEWSYRLLDSDERRTFRRVAVFPAPFTLEAATAVAGAGSEELVLRLVRRSLLTAPRQGADGRSRYRMLETVRAFSFARLDGEGERHGAQMAMARWMLHETERIARSFDGPDDGQAGRWGDAEQDNLREAWKTLQEADAREGLRLAIAMGPWALLRGHYAVGRRMLEHGLATLSGDDPDLVAAAELWLGRLGHYSSDFATGLESLRRAEAIWRGRSTKRELVDTLTVEAWMLMNLGKNDEARDVGREALALSEELEYTTGIVYSLEALNVIESYAGNNAAAVDLARETLAIDLDHCAGHAKRYALTSSALSLGLVGDFEWAERLLTECLALCREAGDRAWELMQLESLARIEFKTGRTEQAGLHLTEATQISVETGESLKLADCLATAAVLVAEHQPETAAVLWGAGRAVADTMCDYRVAIADMSDRADIISEEDSAFMTAPMLSVRERLGLDVVRAADERGAGLPMEAVLELVRDVTAETPAAAEGSERSSTGLSKRERELVDLVAQGLTDAEIAEKLFISFHTVRSHLDRIKVKTGARRRAELTRLAVREGLS